MEIKVNLALVIVALAALSCNAFAMRSFNFGFTHGRMHDMEWNSSSNYNYSAFNSTQVQQFRNAVLSNDYQTAKQLSQQYGIGNGFMGMLNQTTFSQYSQIENLIQQLRQELGRSTQKSVNPTFRNFRGFGPNMIGRWHHRHPTYNMTNSS